MWKGDRMEKELRIVEGRLRIVKGRVKNCGREKGWRVEL